MPKPLIINMAAIFIMISVLAGVGGWVWRGADWDAGVPLTVEHHDFVARGKLLKKIRGDSDIRRMVRNGRLGGPPVLAWKVRTRPTRVGCVADAASVSLLLGVAAPIWRDRVAAKPSVQAEWDRFVEQLGTYENNRNKPYVDAANEIERTLLTAKPMNDCGDLKAALDAKARAILRRYEKKAQGVIRSSEHARKSWLGGLSQQPGG